jgi:predicted HicB family RNase H-like nuclease
VTNTSPKKALNLRLPAPLHAKLAASAERNHRSITAEITHALTLYLADRKASRS